MKPPVETVRVSQRSRDILARLKKRTGVETWNVLCRWAFCSSLANPSLLQPLRSGADSSIEMSWKVFGGEIADVLICALRARAIQDECPIDDQSLANYFKAHLERGILQIQNATGLGDLAAGAIAPPRRGA